MDTLASGSEASETPQRGATACRACASRACACRANACRACGTCATRATRCSGVMRAPDGTHRRDRHGKSSCPLTRIASSALGVYSATMHAPTLRAQPAVVTNPVTHAGEAMGSYLSLCIVCRRDLPRLERGFPLFLCVLLVFCMYTRYIFYNIPQRPNTARYRIYTI